jgi:hypothetical protein
MPATESWVHGNIVEVEAEERSVKIIRKGWGTHFLLLDPDTYWFHIPVPTLSTGDNVRPRLSRVFVFFGTNGTEIREIHVYDGPIKVGTFDDLHITGDHSVEADADNHWPITPAVEVVRGIGISVGVQILQGGQIGLPEILFTAAGAFFESP